MVKNEEQVIVPTIASYADAGIDAFFIFDTGSTDATVEKAQAYFKEKKLSRAFIAQEPFVDFATSRNRGLRLAQEKFPHAGFFMMPDAEWYLRGGKKLLEWCKNNVTQPHSAYLVRITNEFVDFYTARLMKGSLEGEFKGVVHETYCPATAIRLPTDIYFELGFTKCGLEKSQKRWTRDHDLLLAEVQKNPQDTRSMFYLAQTLQCLGKLEESAAWYTKRSTLTGWPEEDFMTRYRLGIVTQELVHRKKEGFAWAQAQEAYLNAFTFRPQRIEPLVHIAQHYLEQDNMQLSYIFALRAAQVPYPQFDVLFVEKDLYEFQRYEILSRCAWYVKEYEVGEWAALMALKARPDMPHLQRNLNFYLTRKQTHSYAAQGA